MFRNVTRSYLADDTSKRCMPLIRLAQAADAFTRYFPATPSGFLVLICTFAADGGVGLWVLVFGFWSLGFGLWVLVFGFWSLGFGLWVLVFGALPPCLLPTCPLPTYPLPFANLPLANLPLANLPLVK